ncbi:alpha/beta fold hydrolase [Nocardiopsis sp. RSe5-2]|uniref:Alpha/beta fold hydrolase n=1 Tax=Nocardiopsis endophytica TaxID=3018445 RepID=A0ABT4U1U5_9ACTN|nr:alpha/beta fold hydrolase [Nocardiopsis endophytica]MDA2810918.1 alpha/beta fold hydrolase [Nocardiopsis endophytica]
MTTLHPAPEHHQGFARLPRRSGAVVEGLPRPFTEALIDHPPNSVAWWRGRWVVSATAWGGRDLAAAVPGGAWETVAAPPGWARRPMTGDSGDALSCLLHDPSEDGGEQIALGPDGWSTLRGGVELGTVADWNGADLAVHDPVHRHASALGPNGALLSVADGRLRGGTGAGRWSVPLPPGCTVSLISCSPGRAHALVVVRNRSDFQTHVFRTADGTSAGPHSLREVLQPVAAWIDEHRAVLVRERWPRLEPVVWNWATGECEPVWEAGALGTVRSLAASPDGDVAYAASTPWVPRNLFPLDAPAPGADPERAQVRTEVVDNAGQPVPCVVHDPPTAPRATCLVFPGGPHEPVWSEYAPLVDVLSAAGWRVVKVNVRSSGLREARFRPRSAFRYGVDDVADACAAARALAAGPVVSLGMSYGGSIASACAGTLPEAVGAVVLAGFVSPCDVADSRYGPVREFAAFAFGERLGDRPRRLGTPHFIAHGEKDDRIPVASLEHYRHHDGADLLRLPGEGHGIHTDSAARAVYPAMLHWMEGVIS